MITEVEEWESSGSEASVDEDSLQDPAANTCSNPDGGDVHAAPMTAMSKSPDTPDTREVMEDSSAPPASVSKSDGSSTPDDRDFVTAEVMFSEVRPETGRGHFELLPGGSDSDDQTSSGGSGGAGTPVPHRVRLVRDDRLQGAADPAASPTLRPSGSRSSAPAASAPSPSARSASPRRSPMNTVEVVKSSEANQWRKEAMQGVCFFCQSLISRKISHGADN